MPHTRRASLRILSAIEARERERKGEGGQLAQIQAYKGKVEDELTAICEKILALISDYLLETAPESAEAEPHVFYQKMRADYFRYLAEFADADEKKGHAMNANASYKTATERAGELAPTHPIRLGLALNYSVFLYEVQNESAQASELAKQAFDDAIAELDTLDEESYKDSTLIMQLLRDNLTLWTSDEDGQQ